MVSICTIQRNDVPGDKFAPTCGLDLPIAQDGSLCNEFLYDAATRNGTRQFQELVELNILCVNFDVCQCVLTGVTT